MRFTNLDRSKKNSQPFPYSIFDQFLQNNDINNLYNEFPDKIFDITDQNTPRKNIALNHPLFQNFLKENKIWNEFVNNFTHPEFIQNLLDYFAEDLNNFDFNINLRKYRIYKGYKFNNSDLDKISIIKKKLINICDKIYNSLLGFINIPSIRVDFECARAKDSYKLKPHTDQRSKFIVLIFYLNDMKNQKGKDISNLILYKNKYSNFWAKQNKQSFILPDPDDLEEFENLSVRKNKLLIMVNSKNSWHGIEEYKSKNFRKFIYMSLSVTNSKKVWK